VNASGRADASPQQQMQDDLVRLEAYRNQLGALLQQQQILVQSRADHARARDALDGLEQGADETEALIPLGAETFVRGKPNRTAPVFIGVGSGVAVEVDRAKAREMVAERLKEIERAGQELEAQMRVIEERVQALSDRLEALNARAERESGASPDRALRVAGDVGPD
jgi:prefoldin alpha subunit